MPKELQKWPDWMPKPQQTSYSYDPVDRRARTDMEVGSILRVNFDTDETVVNCILVLNRIQSAWFETFERNYINQGASWFEMPLQTGGEINTHKVRMNARPKVSNVNGNVTTYTIKLDIDKRNEFDDLYMYILGIWSPEEFYWFVNYLHKVLHTEAPGVTILPNDLPWVEKTV